MIRMIVHIGTQEHVSREHMSTHHENTKRSQKIFVPDELLMTWSLI